MSEGRIVSTLGVSLRKRSGKGTVSVFLTPDLSGASTGTRGDEGAEWSQEPGRVLPPLEQGDPPQRGPCESPTRMGVPRE